MRRDYITASGTRYEQQPSGGWVKTGADGWRGSELLSTNEVEEIGAREAEERTARRRSEW